MGAPDSLQLVFATTDEPVLYCLSFQAGAEAAVPVMDLSMVTFPSSGEAAGGLVQDLQWEPTGRRLAVSFRETAPLLLLRCLPSVGSLDNNPQSAQTASSFSRLGLRWELF